MSCGHCQRLIDFMDRPGHAPSGTDPTLLHPIFLPHPPRYSVLCSCGHYTFYVDDGERDKYEHQLAEAIVTSQAAKAAKAANGDVVGNAGTNSNSDAG